MLESSQNVNHLPYRARIMMHANADNGKRASLNSSDKKCVINSCMTLSLQGDLQPLQWLQRETILAIAPLDHEEEFVAGREEIVDVETSPVKVEVVSDSGGIEEVGSERSTTIEDFYRYQAMRAALASVNNHNGIRGGQLCVSRPSLSQSATSINEYQKPPFSYTHIIFMAIETSPHKAMTVNDIYVWCESHFPYYTQAGVGWKNSLRHNLSINKSFKKISRDGRKGGPGRGAYWVVEPRERNNLIDAIRRSPCSLGHFPFLNNTYPWGSGSCYSNAFLQASNSFNNNITPLSTRSLMPNKVHQSLDTNTASTRGPLLRIGGQITDASQLICSSPVIRLGESSSNNSQVISTVPPVQSEQINLVSDVKSSIEGPLKENIHDEEDHGDVRCKGKLIVHDEYEGNCDFDHSYMEIIRGLMDNELIDKSDSGRTESIKQSQHLGHTKDYSDMELNSQMDVTTEGSARAQDIPSLSREIIKRERSLKQRKKSMKYEESDCDDNVTSVSNEEYSDQSDTDFNWRISLGRRKQTSQTKSVLFNKLKSLTKHRKLNCRSHVSNIIRAPHVDHVYALLQDFLLPANNVKVSEVSKDHSMDNDVHSLSEEVKPNTTIDLSLIALSKRSKHKLQIVRGSSRQVCYSDSDNDCHFSINGTHHPLEPSQCFISLTETKRKSNHLLFMDNDYESPAKEDKLNESGSCESYDDEQENRYYDENNHKTINIKKKCFIKDEDLVSSFRGGSNHSREQLSSKENLGLSLAKKTKGLVNIKRKVGRPKKVDGDYSETNSLSKEHKQSLEKITGDKLRKTVKLLKNEIKYLKESNSNKKLNSSFCNKEDQAAIDILVNLKRKSQQDRINNMYSISNFIAQNHSHSNNTS